MLEINTQRFKMKIQGKELHYINNKNIFFQKIILYVIN